MERDNCIQIPSAWPGFSWETPWMCVRGSNNKIQYEWQPSENSLSHSSCFLSSTHPQNHFNLPHPWVIYQRLNMPTQHFIAEAFCTFNSKLSRSRSPSVWLYGAPGREGEVERCWVSTWKEEHPNCGPQWGSVCPVPGCWLLAPGLLQRWSGDGDGFLQHKHHGWEGRNLYWKNLCPPAIPTMQLG